MTSPLPIIVDSEDRGMKRPVEECCDALRFNVGFLQPLWKLSDATREAYARHVVTTTLREMRRLGFLNDNYFVAKKAEEAGDEERTST